MKSGIIFSEPETANDLSAHQLLEQRLHDSDLLMRRITAATRAAVLAHKAAGNPVCTWQDGKVVWIAPEDIDLPELDPADV